jgi:hypothetical protein
MCNPRDKETLNNAQEQVFDLLLFKARDLKVIPYVKPIVFAKGEVRKARKIETILRITILTIFSIEVFFTAIDLILT